LYWDERGPGGSKARHYDSRKYKDKTRRGRFGRQNGTKENVQGRNDSGATARPKGSKTRCFQHRPAGAAGQVTAGRVLTERREGGTGNVSPFFLGGNKNAFFFCFRLTGFFPKGTKYSWTPKGSATPPAPQSNANSWEEPRLGRGRLSSPDGRRARPLMKQYDREAPPPGGVARYTTGEASPPTGVFKFLSGTAGRAREPQGGGGRLLFVLVADPRGGYYNRHRWDFGRRSTVIMPSNPFSRDTLRVAHGT